MLQYWYLQRIFAVFRMDQHERNWKRCGYDANDGENQKFEVITRHRAAFPCCRKKEGCNEKPHSCATKRTTHIWKQKQLRWFRQIYIKKKRMFTGITSETHEAATTVNDVFTTKNMYVSFATIRSCTTNETKEGRSSNKVF